MPNSMLVQGRTGVKLSGWNCENVEGESLAMYYIITAVVSCLIGLLIGCLCKISGRNSDEALYDRTLRERGDEKI